MTSNIGSEYLLEGNDINSRNQVSNELKTHFKPEFLNRIDDIVYFNSLDDSVVTKIVMKFIDELQNRLKNNEITIGVDQKAIEIIVKQGFDKIYGARPLKRYIQKEIETPLARDIIAGRITPKSYITISYDNDHFLFIKK